MNNPYSEPYMDGFRDAELNRKAYEAEYHGRIRIPRKGFASPEQMAISVGDEVTDNVRKGIVTAVSDDLVTVNVGGGYELCYWRSDLYRAKADPKCRCGHLKSWHTHHLEDEGRPTGHYICKDYCCVKHAGCCGFEEAK